MKKNDFSGKMGSPPAWDGGVCHPTAWAGFLPRCAARNCLLGLGELGGCSPQPFIFPWGGRRLSDVLRTSYWPALPYTLPLGQTPCTTCKTLTQYSFCGCKAPALAVPSLHVLTAGARYWGPPRAAYGKSPASKELLLASFLLPRSLLLALPPNLGFAWLCSWES